jgi:hypothetical protein
MSSYVEDYIFNVVVPLSIAWQGYTQVFMAHCYRDIVSIKWEIKIISNVCIDLYDKCGVLILTTFK